MPAGSGPSSSGSFAFYDPDSSLWRTYQGSFLSAGGTPWEKFSEGWPRAGMTRNGIAFRRPPLAPLTYGIGSGLWPTLTVNGRNLNVIVAMFPTPKASADKYGRPRENDWGDLQAAVRSLYPTPVSKPGGGMALDGGSNSRKAARRRGLLPTPKSSPSGPDYARQEREESGGDDLATVIARTTPGPLNPTWVEWLMGFPLGTTACDFSGLRSSRKSRSGSDTASKRRGESNAKAP